MRHNDAPKPVTLIYALWAAQKGKCFHCSATLDLVAFGHENVNGWTREHVLPRCRGGSTLRNLVLAHARCNQKRGSKPPTAHQLLHCQAIWSIMMATHGWTDRMFAGLPPGTKPNPPSHNPPGTGSNATKKRKLRRVRKRTREVDMDGAII